MEPRIDGTRFGNITIAGDEYDHDVVIRLGGKVKKRKKKLSKEETGSSHAVSRSEAEYILDQGATRVIIGTGQYGALELTKEAATFFRSNQCAVEQLPTPLAVQAWNAAQGNVIAMFHVTC